MFEGWRKSSRSVNNGQCVEVGNYRKARASGSQGACVEVGNADAVIAVRDTTDRGGVTLEFSGVSWGKFLKTI